jgi:hypothetical protein
MRAPRLAHSHDGGDNAACFQLMILRADLGFRADQHLLWRPRIGGTRQASFAQRIERDDRHAARAPRDWYSIRGLSQPTFWPKKKIPSVAAKSARITVPTGTPMLSGRATDVLSWRSNRTPAAGGLPNLEFCLFHRSIPGIRGLKSARVRMVPRPHGDIVAWRRASSGERCLRTSVEEGTEIQEMEDVQRRELAD